MKTYRYYEFVMAAFVTVLICSNLIGPAKIVQFDWLPFAFGAGVLFFPVSYVFGDILTEVYGYARAPPGRHGRAARRGGNQEEFCRCVSPKRRDDRRSCTDRRGTLPGHL